MSTRVDGAGVAGTSDSPGGSVCGSSSAAMQSCSAAVIARHSDHAWQQNILGPCVTMGGWASERQIAKCMSKATDEKVERGRSHKRNLHIRTHRRVRQALDHGSGIPQIMSEVGQRRQGSMMCESNMTQGTPPEVAWVHDWSERYRCPSSALVDHTTRSSGMVCVGGLRTCIHIPKVCEDFRALVHP